MMNQFKQRVFERKKCSSCISIHSFFKKWAKSIVVWLLPIQVMFLVFSTGCTKTVTRYRTQSVPVEVTEYRNEYQTVEREVEVPFIEEVKTPKYRVTRKPMIASGFGSRVIGILPFTTSTGRQEEGQNLLGKIENAIISHPRYRERFRMVSSQKILAALGKENERMAGGTDTQALVRSLNIDLLITGHVKNSYSNRYEMKLDVFDLKDERSIAGETLNGTTEEIMKRVEQIFYGSQTLVGYTVEKVNKTRMEKRQVTELVKKPYQTTKYQEKTVEYQAKVFDFWTTVAGIGLILLVAASSDQKK